MSSFPVLLYDLTFPISIFCHYYIIILIIAAILSWLEEFNVLNKSNHAVEMICTTFHKITDPYLKIFRRIIPPVGIIDFSPMVGIIALIFFQSFFSHLLMIIANAIA